MDGVTGNTHACLVESSPGFRAYPMRDRGRRLQPEERLLLLSHEFSSGTPSLSLCTNPASEYTSLFNPNKRQISQSWVGVLCCRSKHLTFYTMLVLNILRRETGHIGLERHFKDDELASV